MHPDLLTDDDALGYILDLNDGEPPQEGDPFLAHLRRHRCYELEQVRLEDIQFQDQPFHPSLVEDYASKPGAAAPPVVLDGVWMTPWDGIHRLQAAKARGDTRVWAYVGKRPRHDRTFIPYYLPSGSWEAAKELHSVLSFMASELDSNSIKARLASRDNFLDLAKTAHLEFMDEEGSSLLGVAVEAWGREAFRNTLFPVLQCLLQRGANPDRGCQMKANPSTARTPFVSALVCFHPSPEMLDPEHPLPPHVWEMFEPYVDLGLSKNQEHIRSWLGRAYNKPLKGAASKLQAAVLQIGMETAIPAPAPPRPVVRF